MSKTLFSQEDPKPADDSYIQINSWGLVEVRSQSFKYHTLELPTVYPEHHHDRGGSPATHIVVLCQLQTSCIADWCLARFFLFEIVSRANFDGNVEPTSPRTDWYHVGRAGHNYMPTFLKRREFGGIRTELYLRAEVWDFKTCDDEYHESRLIRMFTSKLISEIKGVVNKSEAEN